MELKPQVCPKCGKEFPSTQALGSHMFWKHEYQDWKAIREDAKARGEPVMSVKGIRGLPKRGKRDPWFQGKFSELVRSGMQLTYFIED